MEFPSDLKYTKEHEWVRVSGSSATVGITEFAQGELGEIVFVELPSSGKTFNQADSICVVESTKAASDVYTPISGTVSEGNSALESSPELVNSDPYGDGWLIKLSDITESDLEKLMDATEYEKYIGEQG
ncbi:MAG: glycine cleavage system protein GcvH [Deltaproteobacteria bacterium]|nr:glycine cleavage system protein GcvH [Deltaproteobacteria bacterium]